MKQLDEWSFMKGYNLALGMTEKFLKKVKIDRKKLKEIFRLSKLKPPTKQEGK